MKTAIAILCLGMSAVLYAVNYERMPIDDPLYVYKDSGYKGNNFIPSGWMGSYRDIKMTQQEPMSEGTCIKISYSAERNGGEGWAGIYWQYPSMNWGNKPGYFNLKGYKKLKFKARGLVGGEYIDKFFMGGISGMEYDGDSDQAETDGIELTKEWKEYEIDLKGLNLSHVIGGFGFVTNADSNPNGIVIGLDDIRYEK